MIFMCTKTGALIVWSKNYQDKWVEITESLQRRTVCRYQLLFGTDKQFFWKEFDNLMTQSLHWGY